MLRTPLYQAHVDAKARMVDFAGWEMPVLYTSIIDEHVWTRRNIGLFDVSHMGRLELSGANAADTLDFLCTRGMVDLPLMHTRYCLMCNEAGGILDDLMISRLEDDRFYVVCNASNRDKIVAHIEANLEPGVALIDRTLQTAMIAIQGPKVAPLLAQLLPPLAALPHRRVYNDELIGIPIIAFRSGYTGEDGIEAVVPASVAPMVWNQLLALCLDGEPVAKPIGLGARDTLRLEAALPLYGHELSEQTDPICARLDFAVDFTHDFIGKEAIERICAAGAKQLRVGVKLRTKRAARQGFKFVRNGQPIGTVTSGAYTPTVDAAIAMGYVQADEAYTGNTIQIEASGALLDADIVPLPFYKRPR